MSIMVPAPTLVPDVEDGAHHDDSSLPDLDLLSNDGARLDPGVSPFVSSMGTAELRQVLSITISAMASCCASMAGPMSRQSPNTIFAPSPAGKTLAFGKLVGERSQR